VVRWWDHCQAREEEEEEDGGWVREGRGRLSGGDGAGDGRQLAIGSTRIKSMWAASKKKHRGGSRIVRDLS